jgi:hypothetical protein
MEETNVLKSCETALEFILLGTGAFLYAPYSFLLISNKYWMGGRWGGGAVRLCCLTAMEGMVWALKPP